MAIYLMRHPETTGASGRCIGHSDVALSDDGRQSVPALAAAALELNPDAVVSSDLSRCRSLALAIYAAGVPIWTQYPAWREVSFGSWENRRWDEISSADSEIYEAWAADFVNIAPPGGESLTDLHRRVWFALDQLREADLGNVVVVTHAGVIRALLTENLEGAFDLKVPFGSIHLVPDAL